MVVLRFAFKFLVTIFAIILIFAGIVLTPTPAPIKARVWDVEWNGSEFAGSVEGPGGQTIPFSGKLLDGGGIETMLGETPFNGSLWQEGSASSGL